MTGVLDVSDYYFCRIIEAATKQEALEWGNRVAAEYNERYGLLPRGNRLDSREVPDNASVCSWSSRRDMTGYLCCKVGHMPDFAVRRNDRVSGLPPCSSSSGGLRSVYTREPCPMEPRSPDQRPVVAGSGIVKYFRSMRAWWRDLLVCFLLTLLVTPADPHSLRHFFLPLASGWMTFRYLVALALYVFAPVAEREPTAEIAPAARGRDVVRSHFQSLRAWPIDLAACMFVTCLVAPSDTNDVWLVFFAIAAFWMTARWLGTQPSAK